MPLKESKKEEWLSRSANAINIAGTVADHFGIEGKLIGTALQGISTGLQAVNTRLEMRQGQISKAVARAENSLEGFQFLGSVLAVKKIMKFGKLAERFESAGGIHELLPDYIEARNNVNAAASNVFREQERGTLQKRIQIQVSDRLRTETPLMISEERPGRSNPMLLLPTAKTDFKNSIKSFGKRVSVLQGAAIPEETEEDLANDAEQSSFLNIRRKGYMGREREYDRAIFDPNSTSSVRVHATEIETPASLRRLGTLEAGRAELSAPILSDYDRLFAKYNTTGMRPMDFIAETFGENFNDASKIDGYDTADVDRFLGIYSKALYIGKPVVGIVSFSTNTAMLQNNQYNS